jgi:hypothetical protein
MGTPINATVEMIDVAGVATDSEPVLLLALFVAFVLAREANEKRKAITA